MTQTRVMPVLWGCLLLVAAASAVALYSGVRQPKGYVTITSLAGVQTFCGLRFPPGTVLLQARYASGDLVGGKATVIAKLRLPAGTAKDFLSAAPFNGKIDTSHSMWHSFGRDNRWHSLDPWVRKTVGIRNWTAGVAKRVLHADTDVRFAGPRSPSVDVVVDLDDPGAPVAYLSADRWSSLAAL